MLALVAAVVMFLGIPALAAEQPCPEVNLESAPDSPFRKIPVYDQDGAGICFAYSASQVTDYVLMKTGQAKAGLVNPIYAAWLDKYKSRAIFTSKTSSGGFQENVLKALKSNGFCSNSEVEQRLSGIKKASGLTDPEILLFLDTTYDAYQSSRSYMGFGSPAAAWDKNAQAGINTFVNECQFKNARLWQDANHLTGITLNKALEQLFEGCKSVKPALPEITVKNSGSDESLADTINQQLRKDRPLAISIQCFDSMDTFGDLSHPLAGIGWPTRNTFLNINGCRNPGDGTHSVVVAGQKMIEGQCHILLRNSHGTYWRGASSPICSCITKHGQYKDACIEQEASEFVGCWYKRSTVLQSADGLASYE